MAYTESAQVDEEAVMSCKFQINDDLDNIRLTWHNAVHLVGAFMLGLLISPFWSWIAWLLWEVGDGFKPWYFEFKPSGYKVWDFLISNLFYSDKFSLQDVFVWNMLGAVGAWIVLLLSALV